MRSRINVCFSIGDGYLVGVDGVFCCSHWREPRRTASLKAKSEGALVLYTAWGLDTFKGKAFAQNTPLLSDVQRSGSERL
jgi:hypothetical protein